MSHTAKKTMKKDAGFTEVPIKLTDREREIIMALRATTSAEEPKRAVPARGGGSAAAKPSGPGRAYVRTEKPAGGAGASSAPARKTYAGATRGKEESKPTRTDVSEDTLKRVNDAFESIDLSEAVNFTQLGRVKVDGTPIYYFKRHVDSTDAFKCMAGEVHGEAISKFVKELDAPAFTIIRALMLKLYAWLKANNATVLEELKSNEHWSKCFREDVLESAEVVFMKDRTKILLGKTASAKPFDDSDEE